MGRIFPLCDRGLPPYIVKVAREYYPLIGIDHIRTEHRKIDGISSGVRFCKLGQKWLNALKIFKTLS